MKHKKRINLTQNIMIGIISLILLSYLFIIDKIYSYGLLYLFAIATLYVRNIYENSIIDTKSRVIIQLL